jgi:RecA/RadA recombinase
MSEEIQSAAIEALLSRRKKAFEKKFEPHEIASAEEVAQHVRFMWVPDLCHQWALGRPGYALGRIMHLLGKEGAGKTTKIYRMIRYAFEGGGIGAMIETEDAVDLSHMASCLGPYYDQFQQLVTNPDSIEAGMAQIQIYLKMFEEIDPEGRLPKILAFDTIAGSGTARLRDDDYKIASHGSFGEKAKIVADSLENFKPYLKRTRTLLILGNQGKEEIPVPVAGKVVPKREIDKIKGQGGRGLDFYTSYWAYVKRGATLTGGEGKIGFEATTTFRKNKLRFPDRSFMEALVYEGLPGWEKPTLKALEAMGIFGLKGSAGKWWCPAIGIDKKDRVDGPEIYARIHSPQWVGWFMENLDIKLPEGGLDAIMFPSAWGDQRPTFTRPIEDMIESAPAHETQCAIVPGLEEGEPCEAVAVAEEEPCE